MELHTLTVAQAHDLLKRGEVTSQELTQAILDRIATVDTQVKSYLSVIGEDALEAARIADEQIQNGAIGPLTGIPIGVKDLMCTRGVRTTCGSRILEDFVPPYDAHVVRLLKAQNAVIVGKLNMDEFAMGSTNEHSAFHNTHNPWNLEHVPGGSSGGSAAAVAADLCLASLGSDTGGSIRQPASHCGVVGLKPTYGRVSRFGLVAFASSLDQIGPLTKTVEDNALVLQAIAGHDPADSTSSPEEVPDYASVLGLGLTGLRVGVPRAYFDSDGLDDQVRQAVETAIGELKSLGASLVEIDLPHSEYGVAAYYIIAPSEASSNLARYDGVKYGLRDASKTDLLEMYRSTRSMGFGLEVQRRILIGTYALSAGYYDAFYGKASQVRTLIMEDFKTAFETCDVIASPVAPTAAPQIGATIDDPLAMYLTDAYTLPVNLAGIPGISVPCGFTDTGLPIGIQLTASHFKEELLLRAANAYEQATDFHLSKPAL
jgi:aspartyl-tRNA(Asn)/glutamyl-tRNA(Gln) amidotransferase subunit A